MKDDRPASSASPREPANGSISAVAPELRSAYSACAEANIRPLRGGHINDTYLVEGQCGQFVLQRLNPIFAPAIHRNISAVTEHLRDKSMLSPRLEKTVDGGDYHIDAEGGCWRLQTKIEGRPVSTLKDATHAHATGALLGRWHSALTDLQHEFVGMRTGVHDTAKHHQTLQSAVARQYGHRLFTEVEPLAQAMMARYAKLPPMIDGPIRIVHGDPKLDNILCTLTEGRPEPTCLIDLDTVGPQPLAHELGDAWRSWCCPFNEDDPRASFRIDLFEASLEGYVHGLGRRLTTEEAECLRHAPDWISLELAMRFAADAVNESYFGWAEDRYASRGEHNLARARAQWQLHRTAQASLPARAQALQNVTDPRG